MATAVLALAGAPGGGAAEAGEALVIHHDLGGSVEARLREVQKLRGQGARIRIEGLCVSACTLYLGLPGTCVTPTAQLGFHGPRSSLAYIPLPRAEFERISQAMAAHYPGRIRQWFLNEARQITRDYYLLSGRQAIAMGARPC